MKMTKVHQEELKKRILAVILTYKHIHDIDVVDSYEKGLFPKSDLVNDLQLRFCFDLFWVVNDIVPAFIDELYEYLNDSHIETALRSICPTVVKRY